MLNQYVDGISVYGLIILSVSNDCAGYAMPHFNSIAYGMAGWGEWQIQCWYFLILGVV